jgi:RimJ/RimL family protein N-acetyltransferase
VPAPEIVTDRLLLTPLSVDDSQALFAYRSLPEVCRYQSWMPSRLQDAIDFIGRLQAVEFDSPATWFQFGIRSRVSGQLIGDFGVYFLEDGRQVEIGFTVAPAHQGVGYASEAVTHVLDYLFGELHKHRVTASVDPRNEASIRLLERVGMQREAHFRESLFLNGEWVDDLVFALLESEWRRRLH